MNETPVPVVTRSCPVVTEQDDLFLVDIPDDKDRCVRMMRERETLIVFQKSAALKLVELFLGAAK